MKNGKSKILGKIFLLIMIFLILKGCGVFNEPETKTRSKNTFRIISSTSTSALDSEIKKWYIKYSESEDDYFPIFSKQIFD